MSTIVRINQFYFKGRLLPTLITIIPLLYLINCFANSYKINEDFNQSLELLPLATKSMIYIALLFLMVQINRLISKEVFQKIYFKDESYMPTTSFLLLKDEYYDTSFKDAIRNKIKKEYNISLLKENDEAEDEIRARRLIVSAVGCIRNSLRDNKLLLQTNLEYSFIRNMIGGCIPAIIASTLIIILGSNGILDCSTDLGTVFLLIYLTIIALSRYLISMFGKYYAKTLYEQFRSYNL